MSLLGGEGGSDQGEGCSMSPGIRSSTASGSVAMSSADNVPLDWKLYDAPTNYCRTHADVDFSCRNAANSYCDYIRLSSCVHVDKDSLLLLTVSQMIHDGYL